MLIYSEYINKFEPQLEEDWNQSAKFQFITFDAFCHSMHEVYLKSGEE